MNLLFRDATKLREFKTFIATATPSIVGQSRPLLEGMRKMVKGGHVIDLVYRGTKDQTENKDQREEMVSIRRLKFILSQLYHSLIELETISQTYNMNHERASLKQPESESSFNLAWNSGRKRYFEYALKELSEGDQSAFCKERASRLQKLASMKNVINRKSMEG